MVRRTRFIYGPTASLSTFDCSLSAQPWTPADETIGGWRDAASGTPASYLVRRDALIDLVLRIEESEWTAFLNVVAFGQSAQAMEWVPDLDDPTTSFMVYLVSPAAGSRWSPTRGVEYPRVFEVSLTLRGRGTAVPWLAYFGSST